MIYPLLNSPLIIALQATAAKNSGNENAYYIGGSLVTIVVALIILQYAWFNPAAKKIVELEKEETDYTLRNEMDYADYMVWAAENGYDVHFDKMSVKDANFIYTEEED
ncbi:hypothetical protein FMM05_16995 [Flavobacterium zepuense]|uniref:Uncharacterized protein n=1 Tax=Flavobacterium zepuense TaxID=2593302 RepID=A0A552UWJ2_9FLAO|nr:hypothetical protein [Flavobacterium zepuense]TRW22577.1 hypothetical protein FMM05_16995 [Flavobacterium zepuense]